MPMGDMIAFGEIPRLADIEDVARARRQQIGERIPTNVYGIHTGFIRKVARLDLIG